MDGHSSEATKSLSHRELRSLFDILSHHTAYNEIEGLKYGDRIRSFGNPIQDDATIKQSSSPSIRLLMRLFILNLPGLRDVTDVKHDFWSQNVQEFMAALADTNLSESFDKGAVGIRRTLSTGVASLVESVLRGVLGGVSANRGAQSRENWDPSKPSDVEAAWESFLQQVIYGDLIDTLFKKTAETADLSKHSDLVRTAHRYVLIMLSSFLHYVLIVSPRGQTMLPLLIRANNLIPYYLVRQTLKIGNVATMLNGMIKIVLAKMNMTTFTSWLGYTVPSDSGMNLLQYIISTVLNWDVDVLKKQSTKLEQQHKDLARTHFSNLRAYCQKSRVEQDRIRHKSTNSQMSLVQCILAEDQTDEPLSVEAHKVASEYLAMHLSIRDREVLVSVLCLHQPDLLTPLVRAMVSAYEPVIRALHKAVDLSRGLSDLQSFLSDLILLANLEKESDAKGIPTVEDFFGLLEKHVQSSHRFVHQACKNSDELRAWYKGYAQEAGSRYRQEKTQGSDDGAAGDVSEDLQTLFTKLSPNEKAEVRGELKLYADYLKQMMDVSSDRLKSVVENINGERSQAQTGPGVYLEHWKELTDDVAVTFSHPNTEEYSPINDTPWSQRGNSHQKYLDDAIPQPHSQHQSRACHRTTALLSNGFKTIVESRYNNMSQ